MELIGDDFVICIELIGDDFVICIELIGDDFVICIELIGDDMAHLSRNVFYHIAQNVIFRSCLGHNNIVLLLFSCAGVQPQLHLGDPNNFVKD